jgi:hypothetical protein
MTFTAAARLVFALETNGINNVKHHEERVNVRRSILGVIDCVQKVFRPRNEGASTF